MLIKGFPAGPWGTNCFVVAADKGSECVIIDPGMQATQTLQQILADNRLKPAAVILTHGHLDHTWSVVPVCADADVPAFIHSADRAMLDDPALGMSAEMIAMVDQMLGGTGSFHEPDSVRELADGEELSILGVSLGVRHAPGHTPGSVVFTVDGEQSSPPVLFSGDLLFAGSIGRTDLPGGDSDQMMQSLRRVLTPLDPDTVVLPGHGPQTTIGEERRTNPFLTGAVGL